MTSPDSPQNNTKAADPAKGYDFDALAKKDANDLEPHEAEALAYYRSNVSLSEYDPDKVAPEDRVVETPERASLTLGELAKDEDQPESVRNEAQYRIDDIAQARGDAPAEEPAPAPKKAPAKDESK